MSTPLEERYVREAINCILYDSEQSFREGVLRGFIEGSQFPLRQTIENVARALQSHAEELATLTRENERLRAVLAVYADKSKWGALVCQKYGYELAQRTLTGDKTNA